MRALNIAFLCTLALAACGGDDSSSSSTAGSSGSGGSGAAGAGGSGAAGAGGSGAAGSSGTSGSAGTGGSSGSSGTAGNAGSAGSGATGGSAGTAGTAGSGGSAGTAGTAGSSGTSGSSGSAGSAGAGSVSDPNVDGPYTTTTLDDKLTSTGSSGNINVHCVYPTAGPTAGPYPVVVVAHGFQLGADQYYGYVERLASFGYVALTVDFPASFTGSVNPDNAKDLIAGLDWAAAKLPGTADANTAGVTGHSLGGKLSLLAATMDPRFKASIVLDPVDGGGGPGGGCNAPNCVDVSALMPSLNIPTGFLGETTDASGGFQPCAPAAENFTTFYAGTNSPSLAVTVIGANHMSFLDDAASCGITCSFCNAATLDNSVVNSMGHAYVAAFYERYLRGNAGYDTYLTGADAQARYVTTGQATIQSK